MLWVFIGQNFIPAVIRDYKRPLPDAYSNDYGEVVARAERYYYSGNYERAKSIYEDLIRNTNIPDYITIGFIGNGWCLIHLERYSEAIDTLKKAEVRGARNPKFIIPVYMGLGIAYYNKRRYLDAYMYFSKVAFQYPEWREVYKDALYFGALAAYMNTSYSEVISLVDTMEKRFPGDEKTLEAQILKVFSYYKNGELFKAIQTLKDVINKGHPNKPKLEIILAEWYAENGNYDSAIVQYENALAKYPLLKDTILSSLSYIEGKYGEAIAANKNIKITNPLVGEVLFYNPGMKAFNSGQMTKAQARFERFIEFFPDDPRSAKITAYMGQLLFQSGSFQKAVEKLEYYIQKYPNGEDMPAVLELLGKAKYRLGDYKGAAEAWDRFLLEYPGHQSAENVKKLLQALVSEHPEVAQYLRSGIGAEAVFNNALALYNRGTYPKAAKMFEDFLRYFPEDPRASKAVFSIGYIAYISKDYDKAINYFSQYVQKYPNGEDIENVLYLYGLALYAKNDYENALGILQKFVQSFPSSEKVGDAYKFMGLIYYKKYEQGDGSAKSQVIYNFKMAAQSYRKQGKTKEAQQLEDIIKQLGG
ncbi:MAG: tetratricopeptide repeat protein [candidate division WOR-3 bacterium]